MDGVFMRKWMTLAWLTAMAVLLCGLAADRAELRENVLRLHVVAASDEAEDQRVKLKVRDGILACLAPELDRVTDPEEAKALVENLLPRLTEAANRVLEQEGNDHRANVSLATEAFPLREYDTFALPAGVYHALRVEIGPAAGRNWWCVVFPQLCYGDLSTDSDKTSSLSDELMDTITGNHKIRFWLLDKLGELENLFFHASKTP